MASGEIFDQDAGAAGGAGLPATVRRVLVLGASRSGISAALALARSGLQVTVSDRRSRESLSGLEDAVGAGVRFLREDDLGTRWPSPDLVVKSPGVPGEATPVRAARARGVPVWSEVELAYALFPNPFDAITGTNGKTTTTALLGHLFDTAARPARILGNIGVAVTSVAGEVSPDEELVVEVSSFQLEDIHAFRPAVGVFLNLTPDHLDRHGSMERYLACKANLFANQKATDVAVLNLADPAVAELGTQLDARSGGPRVAFFSASGPTVGLRVGATVGGEAASPRPESWVDGGWMFLQGEPALPVSDIRLPGLHNLENCLAAGTAAIARGVEKAAVAEGLRTFAGVAHRLERAGIVSGVTYVNDSKATNVEATLTALNAFPEGTHLILGGRDKASDYRPIARACARGCKAIYLIGEATPLVEAAFAEVRSGEGLDDVPVPKAYGDLERAVRAAAKNAVPGDVVLLAPACASFDQYGSFEERGEHFRAVVDGLAGGA
ncbi:MAG: UDP-N-acetylmuramoyl-L-alanine--D-glutamate ligase [bacterium]